MAGGEEEEGQAPEKFKLVSTSIFCTICAGNTRGQTGPGVHEGAGRRRQEIGRYIKRVYFTLFYFLFLFIVK